MDRDQHARVVALADGVRASKSLPAELDTVLAAGIEATRPAPSTYERMLEPRVDPTWRSMTGVPDDLRPASGA